MHYGFIPVDEERQISAKRVLDRKTFQHFHDDLDKHLQESLRWYEGGIKLDTLEDSKREYINIDKLKDQPRLYRDVRENNNVLNPVADSLREGKPVKLNKRQAMAFKRQQELASAFAYTVEASEDVARQRFSFDYRQEQAEAKEKILDTREDAVNAQWNLARKERQEARAEKEKYLNAFRSLPEDVRQLIAQGRNAESLEKDLQHEKAEREKDREKLESIKDTLTTMLASNLNSKDPHIFIKDGQINFTSSSLMTSTYAKRLKSLFTALGKDAPTGQEVLDRKAQLTHTKTMGGRTI